MKDLLLASFIFSCLIIAAAAGYARIGFDPLEKFMGANRSRDGAVDMSVLEGLELDGDGTCSPVYVGPQGGLMESDKIDKLPGQPDGVDFDQYAGYVTVDPNAGRALFYYFTEAPEENASTKPLVLWLNGGPGCSSFGNGAMMELGPFRVNSDNTTLSRNIHAWNNVANVIFLESPAGVGFSYSNTTSDYDLSGDTRTAQDSYTFLVNWLERFPQYKTRDFYITGESYAGHYVPQLAHTILQNNKITNQTVINLQGIAIGNAWIDDETSASGTVDYFWTHALISDEIYEGIILNCNFSSEAATSSVCQAYIDQISAAIGDIFDYNIYAPLCKSSSSSTNLPVGGFDPCSDVYIESYLNLPQVQKALHANATALPYPWTSCSNQLKQWADSPSTMLPTIKQLMANGLPVWLYSGDTDANVPVTSTRYAIKKLDPFMKRSWYPWYTQGEVIEGLRKADCIPWQERANYEALSIDTTQFDGLEFRRVKRQQNGGVLSLLKVYKVNTLMSFPPGIIPEGVNRIIAREAVGYQNLTFATVRGSGHFVPSYQPARALTLFSSFLEGKLPPSS